MIGQSAVGSLQSAGGNLEFTYIKEGIKLN